jgi:hypothetical protein
MSVTYGIGKENKLIELDNRFFDPSVKEDAVFNPRIVKEYAYSTLNVSNVSAMFLYHKLNLNDFSDNGSDAFVGHIPQNLLVMFFGHLKAIEFLISYNKEHRMRYTEDDAFTMTRILTLSEVVEINIQRHTEGLSWA